MPKYKYVDGVKYRVVPQSVLGYALVKEGSDNSLPSGGTEGQVLAKASDADFDVEWATVESGGGSDVVYVDFKLESGAITQSPDISVIDAAYDAGKIVIARLDSRTPQSGSNGRYFMYLADFSKSSYTGYVDNIKFSTVWTINSGSAVNLEGFTLVYNGTNWEYYRSFKAIA